MKHPSQIQKALLGCLMAITLSTGPVPLNAQTATGATQSSDLTPSEKANSEDMVVTLDKYVVSAEPITGSQIRGIEPTGTKLIVLDAHDIELTGTFNTNDLLSKIPQMSTFNQVPFGGGTLQSQSNVYGGETIAQSLRGLPTLILFNGHRLSGSGIMQTSPDVTIIPPGILERVEILPDGGSSIYGSDAIAGVINFVTRKDFTGTEINAHYGVALPGFYQAGVDITKGWKWSTGSAVASYDFFRQSALMGRDRDWYTSDFRPWGGTDQRTLYGTPGTILANGIYYKMNSGPTAGSQAGALEGKNYWDSVKSYAIYPLEYRHSLYATLQQKIGSNVTFDGDLWWSREYKDNKYNAAEAGTGTGIITSANPYFSPVGSETSHTVYFTLKDYVGDTISKTALLNQYGASAKFKVKLPREWQLSFPMNYSQATDRFTQNTLNAIDNAGGALLNSLYLAGTTTATAINPYNVLKSNPAVLKAATSGFSGAYSLQKLATIRVVADGPMFNMAGGSAHIAVGTELRSESIDNNVVSIGQQNALPTYGLGNGSRHVMAAFTEMYFPLVGPNNESRFIHALNLSTSARVDSYSDYGTAKNPRYGISYQPSATLTLRASYGTSFIAPTFVQGGANIASSIFNLVPWGVSLFQPPSGWPKPEDASRGLVIISGGNPTGALKPQTSQNSSFGIDWSPKKFLNGFTFSATVYNVDYKDTIGTALQFAYTGQIYTNPALQRFAIINPTLPQLISILGTSSLRNSYWPGYFVPSSVYQPPYSGPFLVIDNRYYNLGRQKIQGVDLSVSYHKKTSFGAVDANILANKKLKDQVQGVAGSAFNDKMPFEGHLNFKATLGATVGKFTANVEANYLDGYPTVYVTQPHIDSYTVWNLYFNYDLRADGDTKRSWARNTSLSLNIGNVFNKDPVVNINNGPFNGGTFGRLVTLSVKKHF